MKNFRNSRELRNIRAINVFNPFFINIIGGRIRFPRKTGEALYYFPEDPKPIRTKVSPREKDVTPRLLSHLLKYVESNPNVLN